MCGNISAGAIAMIYYKICGLPTTGSSVSAAAHLPLGWLPGRTHCLRISWRKCLNISGTDLLTVTSSLLFIIFPILYYDNYDTMITMITVWWTSCTREDNVCGSIILDWLATWRVVNHSFSTTFQPLTNYLVTLENKDLMVFKFSLEKITCSFCCRLYKHTMT